MEDEDEREASLTDEERDLARSEAGLRDLEGRLERLKEPQSSSNGQFAKGLALVASFGFILAGCLIAGLLLGEYLVDKTGYRIFQLLGALFGLVTALFAGAKLMKPLMNSKE